MIWVGLVIGVTLLTAGLYFWIHEHIDPPDKLTFERKMEAMKKALDEARRWR